MMPHMLNFLFLNVKAKKEHFFFLHYPKQIKMNPKRSAKWPLHFLTGPTAKCFQQRARAPRWLQRWGEAGATAATAATQLWVKCHHRQIYTPPPYPFPINPHPPTHPTPSGVKVNKPLHRFKEAPLVLQRLSSPPSFQLLNFIHCFSVAQKRKRVKQLLTSTSKWFSWRNEAGDKRLRSNKTCGCSPARTKKRREKKGEKKNIPILTEIADRCIEAGNTIPLRLPHLEYRQPPLLAATMRKGLFIRNDSLICDRSEETPREDKRRHYQFFFFYLFLCFGQKDTKLDLCLQSIKRKTLHVTKVEVEPQRLQCVTLQRTLLVVECANVTLSFTGAFIPPSLQGSHSVWLDPLGRDGEDKGRWVVNPTNNKKWLSIASGQKHGCIILFYFIYKKKRI